MGATWPLVARRIIPPTTIVGAVSILATHLELRPEPRRLTTQTSQPRSARYRAKLTLGSMSQNSALYVKPWQRITGKVPGRCPRVGRKRWATRVQPSAVRTSSRSVASGLSVRAMFSGEIC